MGTGFQQVKISVTELGPIASTHVKPVSLPLHVSITIYDEPYVCKVP